jgi:fumarate reductase flavoprotein subunit
MQTNIEEVNTQVVVIGSGASGLAAALTAAEGGLKVIILEKRPRIGGTSNFAEGLFAVESEMQLESYISYSRDQAFKNMMDYSHWRANPRLVRAFVDKSASTIAWLKKQGVEFVEVTNNMPEGFRTWHVVKGPTRARGSALTKILLTRVKEKGANLWLATEAKRLIKKGNRVSGVIAQKEGKTWQINAKAVVIASGGYANNKKWIKKYTGLDVGVHVFPIGNVGKMGDGIRMAWEAGAAEEGMGILHTFRIGPMGRGVRMLGHPECATLQPDLWVDQRGERFCDESIAFNDTFEGNAHIRLREGYSYTIFDEALKQYMVEHGIEKGAAYKNLPGTQLVNFDKELTVALEKGNPDVFVAGSIKELAGKIKVDPKVLKATVGEYNRFCEQGHDELFAKDPKYLRPIKNPTFYAMRAHAVMLGTLGGIKINHLTEVLDKEEEVIPGLYAIGIDAAGLYGDCYNFKYSSGATFGFAINSGRMAGEGALSYISRGTA